MKRTIATIAALLVAAGGIAVSQSRPSDAAGPGVYWRKTTASTNLTSAGQTPTLLKSVSIPAGTWIVTAKANPVNFGQANYMRCSIVVGSTVRDTSATLLGNASPGPTGEVGPSVAQLFMQAAVATTATQTFKLTCQHDFAEAGTYVDGGASLVVEAAPGALG